MSLFEQASKGGPIDRNKLLISGAAGGLGMLAVVASPFFAGVGPGLNSLLTQLYEDRWDVGKVDYARVGAVTATGTLVGGFFGKFGNIGEAVHKVAAECVGAVAGYLTGWSVDNAWEATQAS